MEKVILINGVEMPLIGYGSFRIKSGQGEKCIREALEVGYRLIDTAQYYMNEEEVGRAVKNSGIEQAYREGKARAIGISNFYPDRLMDFLELCGHQANVYST